MPTIYGNWKNKDRCSDHLDWEELRGEFTWDKIWRERTWKEIAETFSVGLIFSLLPTVNDVLTDSLSANNFIFGTKYIKKVYNLTDQSAKNCTHVGRYIEYSETAEPSVLYEVVECFERDQIWGCLTLSFIFLPGIIGAPKIFRGWGFRWTLVMLIFGWPFFIPLMMCSKVATLLNPGKHWRKLTTRMTAAEGFWEATMELLLSFFIVLSRADRDPSTIQLASMATSLIMIVKTGIADFLRDQPPMELYTEVQATVMLLPLFLSSTFFKLGSWAVIAALLRYWTVILGAVMILIPWLVGLLLAFYFGRKNKIRIITGSLLHVTNLNNQGGIININKEAPVDLDMKAKRWNFEMFLFHNMMWFITLSLLLTTITIAANLTPDLTVPRPEPWPLWNWSKHKLSDTAIVKNILLLNTIYTIIMTSGLVSVVLIYMQIVRPFKEHVLETRRDTQEQ